MFSRCWQTSGFGRGMSEFSFEGAVQDGGEEGVEFGSGFRLRLGLHQLRTSRKKSTWTRQLSHTVIQPARPHSWFQVPLGLSK